MGLKTSNKISANEFELEVSVSPEEFNKEVDKVYKKEIKKINVPGFRKGKAPRAFVEKYYGEGVFFEEAIKNLYPKALEGAVKEANIELVEVNKLDVVTSSKKEGLVFKANVISAPEVKIDNYKGIEIEKVTSDVTEEDLNKELKDIRDKNSRLVTVDDRPAKMGDTVVIDFEGFMNGKAFEGGKATNFTLELGKKQFINGFEEQIVGHNTGENFEINVKFPENYHVKNYSGKDAVFKIHLYEIKEKELPELDDEFIKDISEFDTLDEFKKDLMSKLKEQKEKNIEKEQENKVGTKLTELIEADIPPAMINRRLDDMMQDFGYQLQSQGINVDDYMRYTGSNLEQMREQLQPQAEYQVKLDLALRKIADLENITAAEDVIDKEYEKIAEHYKIDKDKIKNIIPREDVERDVRSHLAMELVKSNLIIK